MYVFIYALSGALAINWMVMGYTNGLGNGLRECGSLSVLGV